MLNVGTIGEGGDPARSYLIGREGKQASRQAEQGKPAACRLVMQSCMMHDASKLQRQRIYGVPGSGFRSRLRLASTQEYE